MMLIVLGINRGGAVGSLICRLRHESGGCSGPGLAPADPGATVRRSSFALLAAVAALGPLAGCGGGDSSPTAPSPAVPVSGPSSTACDVLGGRAGLSVSIVNGVACSTANSPVVLLNLRHQDGFSAGACSGTVIAPRAVLTAAHCLDEGVAGVRVWRGVGEEIVATSFHSQPRYDGNDSSFDIGVVLTGQDLERPAVPLLLGRDARVGEQAIIAGWGRDELDVSRVLRAGTTTLASVGAALLETRYTPGAAGSGVCAGDSGGPILASEGGWAVAGVTSALSSSLCVSGSNYYANLRHPDNRSFVLGLVPGATQR